MVVTAPLWRQRWPDDGKADPARGGPPEVGLDSFPVSLIFVPSPDLFFTKIHPKNVFFLLFLPGFGHGKKKLVEWHM